MNPLREALKRIIGGRDHFYTVEVEETLDELEPLVREWAAAEQKWAKSLLIDTGNCDCMDCVADVIRGVYTW